MDGGLRIEATSAQVHQVEVGATLKVSPGHKEVSSPTSPQMRINKLQSSQEKERTEQEIETDGPESGEYTEDSEFAQIQKDGAETLRRGTLDSIQGEVFHARKSQRDLLKTVNSVRRTSQECDFVIDNSMRRFTIAHAVIQRMRERSLRAQRNNFLQGSEESTNLNNLRKHAHSIMDKVRHEKLKQEVSETKHLLQEMSIN